MWERASGVASRFRSNLVVRVKEDLERLTTSLPHSRPRRHTSPSAEDGLLPFCTSGQSDKFLMRRLGVVASYSVNRRALAHARRLIDAHQYVLNSDWGEAQPKAADENAFRESHSWEEYAEWYLGLTEGASEDTKARYAFVYGDFRRVHRTGLIACQYRAAEWRHKEVELAAHDLLQHLDSKRA